MIPGLIVGITGSSYGATQRQQDSLRQLFVWLRPGGLRHGDCVGADAQGHDIYREVMGPNRNHAYVLIHPPRDHRLRAGKIGNTFKELPYLERDKYIAGCVAGFRTDLLIAMPRQPREVLRSGTWATVRYARRAGTPVIILLP